MLSSSSPKGQTQQSLVSLEEKFPPLREMVGHVMHRKLDPDHPASLSHAIIQGVLRDELGFEGVVICDDIRMKAISSHYSVAEALLLAINAGVDAIMIAHVSEPQAHVDSLLDAVENAVQTGRLDPKAIERSCSRILAAKKHLNR